MIYAISRSAAGEAIEQNTEPFVNEAGLLTRMRTARDPLLPVEQLKDADYIVEDDYGRIWSREFFCGRNGLFAGPPHQTTAHLANYGYLSVPFRQVPRRIVQTGRELYEALSAFSIAGEKLYPDRVVVYRGQSQEHILIREPEEREKLFNSTNVIEPSLRPSGARRKEMSTLGSAVWSQLVQMQLAARGGYAPAHRFLATNNVWPHATRRGTIVTMAFAQHYGLPTPALDVTSDIRVALWFALHTFSGSGALTAAPAEGGEGVVYVIAGPRGQHCDENSVPTGAVRPQRQQGGFLASNWGNSKNRAVRYLVGAVYFPHSLAREIEHDLPSGRYLFPGPDEDDFVSRIQHVASYLGSPALTEIAAHIYWVDSPVEKAAEAMAADEGLRIEDREDRREDKELLQHFHAGDLTAAYRLALRRYVAGNHAEAERWSRVAAEGGNLDAAWLLGTLLSRRGDPEGERWTRKGADAGHPDAMNNLAMLHAHRGEHNIAEGLYRRAAESGVIAAAYNLGTLLYRLGGRAEGEHWLSVAAKAGDPDASCNLGKILFDRGDRPGAERWFQLAAEGGVVAAAYNMGQLCESTGRIDEARRWFHRAAAAGDADAPYQLARIERNNQPQVEK